MLKLHTAATLPAVTTAEAKLHLRVDHSDEDALIDALVSAATADAEHIMGRAVMPQKWQLSIEAFPVASGDTTAEIELPRPPVTAIDSITYVGSDGVDATVAAEDFQLASASDYTAYVAPLYGEVWPTARDQAQSVRVVFTCGYANAAAVPEPIKAWIKLRVGALYANREAWTVGAAIERNPFVDSMLDRYRVF